MRDLKHTDRLRLRVLSVNISSRGDSGLGRSLQPQYHILGLGYIYIHCTPPSLQEHADGTRFGSVCVSVCVQLSPEPVGFGEEASDTQTIPGIEPRASEPVSSTSEPAQTPMTSPVTWLVNGGQL